MVGESDCPEVILTVWRILLCTTMLQQFRRGIRCRGVEILDAIDPQIVK